MLKKFFFIVIAVVITGATFLLFVARGHDTKTAAENEAPAQNVYPTYPSSYMDQDFFKAMDQGR